MKNTKTILHQFIRILPLLLTSILLCLLLPFSATAADDDTPFFAGATGSPNVMILFDNSNSMQDSPYFRDDGASLYRPKTNWRRGVKINNGCDADTSNDKFCDIQDTANYDATLCIDPCIADDTPGTPGGSIQFDESKWISTSTSLTLPGQNAPNLPGLSTTESVITSFQSSSPCPAPNGSLTCSDRIYDTNVDWSAISDGSDFYPYRYWKIKVTDLTNNTIQYRSINWRSSTGNYWSLLGDDLEYDTSHNYKYEIISGSAGEVTAENTGNYSLVYDRNFDWSSLTSWTVWNSIYRYKIIEIYAGTNAGEQRVIINRHSSYGYWIVDSPFPVQCDYTTKYRILGSEDDNKKAEGGNHPDSKMYQAKLALDTFLRSSSIKTVDTDPNTGATTDRYLMNLGFATFLQARVPITRARYYRKRGLPPRFRYLYRANYNTSKTTYNSTGCVDGEEPSSATFTLWGNTYSNIPDGGVVDRPYYVGNCREQTIRYKVTYTCEPGPDGTLPDQVKIYLESNTSWTDAALAGVDPEGNDQWGYTWIGWRYFDDTNYTGDCTTFSPPDPLWATNHLVQNGDTCYEDCQEVTETPYYETTWRDTYGDLRKSDPATPGYIITNPGPGDPYLVTPYAGHCSGIPGDDWLCTNPDPDDISGDGTGDWTLLTADLVNVPINAAGDLGTRTSEIFDYSTYRYPGRTGDADHPHGWSYKRTARDPAWLTSTEYKKDDNSYLTDDHFIYVRDDDYKSIWSDATQPTTYFPAITGSEFTNYQEDDQVVFINLPEYGLTLPNKGDDYSGENITEILNYINLARVEYPPDRSYVHTMAPINKGSLTVNSIADEATSGTPLAATLADARKYIASYIEQDDLSQGGCRKNYIILLTDGTESAGGDPVAEAAALQNLVVAGESRPVKVYVIGFGLDAASQVILNDIAVAGGSSKAYFANDVDSLVTILAHDITGDILSGSYGRTKVALTRGGLDTSNGLTLYNAYFDWPTWRGHLEAWSLYPDDVYDGSGDLLHRAGEIMRDSVTGEKIGEPHWKDGCGGLYSPSVVNDPDAGCIMAETYDGGDPSADPAPRRTLYTTKSDGSRIAFNTVAGNISDILPLLSITDDDINGDSVSGDSDDAKTIINYINHLGYDNKKYASTRDGNWPLADIYNSGPVLVTAPLPANCVDADNNGVLDSASWDDMAGYCDFAELHKNRESFLYFGSNGGILQSISAGKPGDAFSGGRENWGYLPQFILPKLKELKEGHRFTMDLTVLAHEVDTSTDLAGTGWKTMLVAGQRKGGKGYIALDVTDPDDPQPMWEFTDSNLGQTWSRPILARILIDGVKTSVLIFGGGYSTNGDEGNRLFILKASDGSILKEIVVGSSSNNVPSQITGVQYKTNNVGTLVDYRTNLEKLPDGTGIDYSDRYTLTEVAYFGDTSGDIYRLDGLNTESGGSWSPALVRLYHPDSSHERPIYYPLVLTDIRNGTRYTSGGSTVETGCLNRYLAAGTGDEHDPTGTRESPVPPAIIGRPLIDYVFEIEDDGGSTVSDESKLQWRLSLGLQLPMDEYGFLLKPDGSKLQKDSKNILSSHIYLMDKAIFDDNSNGWTLDGNGHLIDPYGELAAYKDEFYFVESNGDLLTDTTSPSAIASGGTYIQLDTSLWLTDKNGMFYDSADGTVLQDTSLYFYDDDGYWDDGLGTRNQVDGADVKLINASGEKLLAGIAGYGGQLYFTTYSPKGGCDAGTSFFYGIKSSGCNIPGGSGLLEYDKAGNKFYSASRRKISLGIGITGGVTLGGGTAYIPQYSPGNDPEMNALPVPVGETRLKYWKQN